MKTQSKQFSSWNEAWRYCVQLHESGEIAEAEEGYAQILAANPEHIDALRLRGLALAQLGRPREGLPLLEQARRLAPGHPLVHLHLGFVLNMLEQKKQAAEAFRAAMRLAPRDAAAAINLAAVAIELGHTDEALEAARQAVANAPQSPEAQHNLGLALLENGSADLALDPLQEALRLRPHFPECWMHLGRAHADLGQLEAAADAYLHCLRQDPNHTGAAVNLANVWTRRGLDEEAIDLYRQVLHRHPDRWEARLSMAVALAAEEERIGEALALLDGVVPPERYRHRVLLQKVAFLTKAGREEDAKTLLAGSKQRDMGYWVSQYALEKDSEEKERLMARIAAAWEEGEGTQEQRVQGSFLLADFYHRGREYDQAFHFYAGGHELLLGMPRSGTSLLEQILDSHPAIVGAGELRDIPRMALRWRQGADADTLRSLAEEHLERLRRLAPGARIVIDKMPHNFQHLGLIARLYPQSPILYCVRDPRDNCLSIFQQNFVAKHAYAHDLADLGQHYRAHVQITERWRTIIPNPMLTVRYEDVVADLRGQVERVLDFLGLPFADACLEFYQNPRKVRTASKDQVTQPLYTSSVSRWKAYEHHLAPLFHALENP